MNRISRIASRIHLLPRPIYSSNGCPRIVFSGAGNLGANELSERIDRYLLELRSSFYRSLLLVPLFYLFFFCRSLIERNGMDFVIFNDSSSAICLSFV